jgi:hypothetical protein
MSPTLFDHVSKTTFHNLSSFVKDRHIKVIKMFRDIMAITECQLHIETNSLESRPCSKHEQQVSITWNKKEILDTTTFYFVVWVLKPNNDISHFF